MKNYLFVFLGFLLLFLSCDDNMPVNNVNSEEREVEDFIVEYYTLMSARNWTAYREFFSKNAILTTIWQDSTDAKPQIFTSTISEFIAQTADGPDSRPIFEEKPINIEIEIKENLAAVWVKYQAKFGTEDHLIQWEGYDLFSLLKFSERWYIASITYVSTETEY